MDKPTRVSRLGAALSSKTPTKTRPNQDAKSRESAQTVQSKSQDATEVAASVGRLSDSVTRAEEREHYHQKRNVDDNLPQYEVSGLSLRLMNHKKLHEIAKCEITESALKVVDFRSDKTGALTETLYDPRMGPVYSSHDLQCITCGHMGNDCSGHEGLIRFLVPSPGTKILSDYPIYHPVYIKWILEIAKCICDQAGHLIIDPTTIRALRGKEYERIRELSRMCKGHKCYVCRQQGIETKASDYRIRKKYVIEKLVGKDTWEVVYPEDLYALMSMIKRSVLNLMGFQACLEATDLFMVGMLVTPTMHRPPLVMGQVTHSEITKNYANIVTNAMNLRKAPDDENMTKEDRKEFFHNKALSLMQSIDEAYHGVPGAAGAVGRETLRKRIGGKKGIVRKNLEGARTNYSGRTVIGPGPSLRVDEVGIPFKWRTQLTTRYEVGGFTGKSLAISKEEAARIVQMGDCNFVERNGIEMCLIKPEMRSAYDPQDGDVIHRFLRDGDLIIVQRNPSLHRVSLMPFKARLVDGSTILINMATTKGFNADFDGDEMNTHLTQSFLARAEMDSVFAPRFCVLSDALGGPLLAAVYDTLTGALLMTEYGKKIGRTEAEIKQIENRRAGRDSNEGITENDRWINREFEDIYSHLTSPGRYDHADFIARSRRIGYDPFTGRGLISLIIGKGIYFRDKLKYPYIYKNEAGKEIKETHLVIEDGFLKQGRVEPGHISHGGTLAHHIYVFGSIHRSIGEEYLDFLSDLQIAVNWFLQNHGYSIDLEDCINEKVTRQIRDEMEPFRREVFRQVEAMSQPYKDELLEERRKAQIAANLSSIKVKEMELLGPYYDASKIKVMGMGTGKGSKDVMVMALADVGLQERRGEPIPKLYGGRIAAFWSPDDRGAHAGGYVSGSYSEGLKPSETFLQMITTRADMTAGKVGVPAAGYIARQIAKQMENTVVAYDGTIRGLGNRCYDFCIPPLGLDPGYLLLTQVGPDTKTRAYINPVNLALTINAEFPGVKTRKLSFEEVSTLFSPERLNSSKDFHRAAFSILPFVRQQIIGIHSELLTRQLTGVELADTPQATQKLFDTVIRLILLAMIEPGTGIGIISCTAISERVTQIILKLKGTIGTGVSKAINDTMGRIEQVLRAPKKKPEKANAFIFFKPRIGVDEALMKISEIRLTLIRDISTGAETKFISEFPDLDYIRDFLSFHPGSSLLNHSELLSDINSVIDDPEYRSEFLCTRINFDLTKLYQSGFKLHFIADILFREGHGLLAYRSFADGYIDVFSKERYTISTIRSILDEESEIMKLKVSGIEDITDAGIETVRIMSIVKNQVKQQDHWIWTPDVKLLRSYPISLSMLQPMLSDNGFESELLEDGNLKITRIDDQDIDPRETLNLESGLESKFDDYNLVYIITLGTNLNLINRIPGVYSEYTYSNYTNEIAARISIEASHRVFIEQIAAHLENVVVTHLYILANYAHFPGAPTPLNRHGSGRQGLGPLSAAANEESLKKITSGAVGAYVENTLTVKTFTGGYIPVGTGVVKLLMEEGYKTRMKLERSGKQTESMITEKDISNLEEAFGLSDNVSVEQPVEEPLPPVSRRVAGKNLFKRSKTLTPMTVQPPEGPVTIFESDKETRIGTSVPNYLPTGGIIEFESEIGLEPADAPGFDPVTKRLIPPSPASSRETSRRSSKSRSSRTTQTTVRTTGLSDI